MNFSNESASPPGDMIFEILARSSLDTLDTCKAVCKDWKQLALDPSFLTSYYGKTGNKMFGFLIQSLVSNKHITKFVSMNESDKDFEVSTKTFKLKCENLKIEASSLQGIICCVKRFRRQYRYYVCKPSTKQWQPIPNPKLRYRTEKVALVVLSSRPLHYRILRISQPRFLRQDCYNYRCELFDSKTWAWKEGEEIILPYGTLLGNNPAVYASRLICWLTSDDNILAFHSDQDTPFTISLPDPICQNDNKQIIEYQGKVGLICKNKEGNTVQLWIMEDWKNENWKKIKEFNLEVLPSEISPALLADFYNCDVALMKSIYTVAFYNLHDCSFKEIKLANFYLADNIFPIRSDFEPVNLKGIA